MSHHARVFSPEEAPPRPLSEIVRDVVQDISYILQSEIRLARTELGGKVDRAKKASGAIGAAAVAGLLCAASLVTAGIAALTLVVPLWLAALIMGILLGAGAAAAFAMGRDRLKAIDPVPQLTVRTLEDNVEWAKQRTR